MKKMYYIIAALLSFAILITFIFIQKTHTKQIIYDTPCAIGIINDVYKDTSGFFIGTGERTLIEEKGGNATYGEILPQSVATILAHETIAKESVFYDLGSGTGKVCVQVALATPARAIGVELASSRHEVAEHVRAELIDKKILTDPKKLRFIHDDITHVAIDDATIIFLCSTCFSEELMRKLAERISQISHPVHVYTLKRLPEEVTGFIQGKTLYLPMTWSTNTAVYMYEKP